MWQEWIRALGINLFFLPLLILIAFLLLGLWHSIRFSKHVQIKHRQSLHHPQDDFCNRLPLREQQRSVSSPVAPLPPNRSERHIRVRKHEWLIGLRLFGVLQRPDCRRFRSSGDARYDRSFTTHR